MNKYLLIYILQVSFIILIIIGLLGGLLFIPMHYSNKIGNNIDIVADEFQNILTLKEKVELKKIKTEKIELTTIKNEYNDYEYLRVVNKLNNKNVSNMFFEKKNNEIILNSNNYDFNFCKKVEYLSNGDIRDTAEGDLAFSNFFPEDNKKYNQKLNKFYNILKNRNIEINEIKVRKANNNFNCSEYGNNIKFI